MGFKATLTELYQGDSERASLFRYYLLGFDILTVAFLIVSSFFHGQQWVEWFDVPFGAFMLADFTARLWIAPDRLRFFTHPFGVLDLIVALSLLIPLAGENMAFLRVLRSIRLLRSYHVAQQLRRDSAFFQKHEDVIFSVLNLTVFLFIMTALVFETQVATNPHIRNYVDALYFTVTALTTTGFGDITLSGTLGRFLSIVIMIFGVTLFIRLIQTVFRPYKVRFPCPACGLYLHDIDAVHCKHCGRILNIPDEGVA